MRAPLLADGGRSFSLARPGNVGNYQVMGVPFGSPPLPLIPSYQTEGGAPGLNRIGRLPTANASYRCDLGPCRCFRSGQNITV